jgi:hypothetical protein
MYVLWLRTMADMYTITMDQNRGLYVSVGETKFNMYMYPKGEKQLGDQG